MRSQRQEWGQVFLLALRLHAQSRAHYDGDGKADLLIFAKNSSDAASIRMAKFQGAPNLRVATITSGFGAQISLGYAPLTSSSAYTEDAGAASAFPVRKLIVPQYVVVWHQSASTPAMSAAARRSPPPPTTTSTTTSAANG